MAAQLMDETKLLSEALGTVKIQVSQMKRYLVRIGAITDFFCVDLDNV